MGTFRDKRMRVGIVGMAAVALVLLGLTQNQQQTVLESAILPPRDFRHWFWQNTRVVKGADNEIPLDRLAGRGTGLRTTTKVPGVLDKETKQVCNPCIMPLAFSAPVHWPPNSRHS